MKFIKYILVFISAIFWSYIYIEYISIWAFELLELNDLKHAGDIFFIGAIIFIGIPHAIFAMKIIKNR